MSEYDPTTDITTSIRENRSVALRPRTTEEMQAIDVALLAECEDSEDQSAAQNDSFISYWGTDEDGGEWTVSVWRV
jgi:hypothetical protein